MAAPPFPFSLPTFSLPVLLQHRSHTLFPSNPIYYSGLLVASDGKPHSDWPTHERKVFGFVDPNHRGMVGSRVHMVPPGVGLALGIYQLCFPHFQAYSSFIRSFIKFFSFFFF